MLEYLTMGSLYMLTGMVATFILWVIAWTLSRWSERWANRLYLLGIAFWLVGAVMGIQTLDVPIR